MSGEMKTLTIGGTTYEVVDEEARNAIEEMKENGTGYPVPCVMDYGAKGDGTADDTAAFQSALAENRVVFVPGGTYILSDTLTIAANCCLELNQDTVLQFTQASGNCIVMQGGATLRGNHAILSVPYAFTGNAVAMDTDLETDRIIPPYRKEGSHNFKRQRFVYDVNIIKETSEGFCRSEDGKCSGTAIYMHCESSAAAHLWMWAVSMSGVRIAGAFSYGIRALNVDSPVGSANHYEDDAWNHDMRLEAVIEACEIGVALENCNCAYLNVVVQPAKAMNGAKYAKHGFYINDAKAVDMTGSRVWDWDAERTLWSAGGIYQHIALIGNCTGLVLSDYLYYWSSADIRDLIYTDTPSNLEKMTILQEPITRWFKPVENEPYFFDGNGNKRLAMKDDIDEYFITDRIPGFTDVLATAIDANGAIYNGVGYKSGIVVGAETGAEGSDGWYVSTGYIPCKVGDTLKTDGLFLKHAYSINDGGAKIVYFDKNFNRFWSATAQTLETGSQYYQAATQTDNGFEILMKSALSERGTLAYVRLSLRVEDWGAAPVISINDEIKFTQAGFLADGIKVKAANVVGGSGGSGGGVTSWEDIPDKPFYEETAEVELASGEFTSELEPISGVFRGVLQYSKYQLNIPQTITITLDGAAYRDLQTVEIPSVGVMFGNLYFLNAMLGTSFPNTGELFFGGVSNTEFMVYCLMDTEPTKHSVKLVTPGKVFHTLSQDFIGIPYFDLNKIGLPNIEGDSVSADLESSELYEALCKGCVQIRFEYQGDKHQAIACATLVENMETCVLYIPLYSGAMSFHISRTTISAYLID